MTSQLHWISERRFHWCSHLKPGGQFVGSERTDVIRFLVVTHELLNGLVIKATPWLIPRATMAVEGFAHILKWLLFALNIIFWLIGLVVLALGAWLYATYGNFLSDIGSVQYLNAPILIITVGSIAAVLGFLGCFSACTENPLCLRVFAVLLIITVLLEIVAGTLAYVNRSAVRNELDRQMSKSMRKYDTSSLAKTAWDFLQIAFKCCGTRNRTEWKTQGGQGFQQNNVSLVPNSCCSSIFSCPATEKIIAYPSSSSNYTVWTHGCYDAIRSELRSRYAAAGATASVLVLIQIARIAFSIILARSAKDVKDLRNMQVTIALKRPQACC